MFARQIFVDSLDFARNGRELLGKVPVAELPRLQDMLATPEGEISYVLLGLQTKGGESRLRIELDGHFQLCCQRCLQSLDYPVKLVSQLILVPEGELDEPADDESEIDSIPADSRLDVLALLEEELLLSLPFSPRHPEGTCRPVEAKEMNQTEKTPFAGLAELKNK